VNEIVGGRGVVRDGGYLLNEGVIGGRGVVTSGGVSDPDSADPMTGRRTEAQQCAYVRALEAERDERSARGEEDGAKLCETEIAKERAEHPDDSGGDATTATATTQPRRRWPLR
jgi:hypothetical protein